MSPEEMDRARAYWEGTPGQTMSSAAPVAPVAPASSSASMPEDLSKLASYYGASSEPVHLSPAATAAVTSPAPSPTPVASSGPTPEDDAAFAAFKSGLAASPASHQQHVAGSNSHASTDPFGLHAAQEGVLGTYDAEKRAISDEAQAERTKASMLADAHETQAREREEDAAIARQEHRVASEHMQSQMDQVQKQLDAVRSKKIDPGRYMANHNKIAALVGAVIGGLYQGLNHTQENPFLSDLNKRISEDIDAQKTQIANARNAIQGRMNLLSQMRAVYKDDEVADLQARNVMYEAAKDRIQAEAARYNDPATAARAEQAINAVDRQQKEIQLGLANAAQRSAQARAAAAAQAARAAKAEAHRRQVEAIKLEQKNRELDIKEREAQGKAGKEQRSQLATLGKELSDEKLVSARKTIDDLKRKLVNPETGEIDGSRGIPGVGTFADTREAVAPPLGQGPLGKLEYFPPIAAVRAAENEAVGLSDEERVGRQEWNRLFDSYKVAVTGAGASEGEIASLRKSFEGAKTPPEQAAAIRLADSMLAERESRLKAGVDPEVARYYDTRVKQERGARHHTVRREPVQ